MTLKVIIDADTGERIDDAINRAIHIANMTGEQCELIHNDLEIKIPPAYTHSAAMTDWSAMIRDRATAREFFDAMIKLEFLIDTQYIPCAQRNDIGREFSRISRKMKDSLSEGTV